MKTLRMLLIFTTCLGSGLLVGCGGGSHISTNNSSSPSTVSSSGANVAAISVNGGPVGNYDDAAFASVTVCAP